MKIAIIGFSGSGKSTLSRKLSEYYNLPVLHIDTVHHLPGWNHRELDDELTIMDEFLNSNDGWVIDGNYFKLSFERRMEEADVIIIMEFNRFKTVYRAHKRYKTYKNSTRPDMAEGCEEKFDFEFFKWLFYKGRNKRTKKKYHNIEMNYNDKVVVLKSQKQIDNYLKKTVKLDA